MWVYLFVAGLIGHSAYSTVATVRENAAETAAQNESVAAADDRL